jgi:hypothetical protein
MLHSRGVLAVAAAAMPGIRHSRTELRGSGGAGAGGLRGLLGSIHADSMIRPASPIPRRLPVRAAGIPALTTAGRFVCSGAAVAGVRTSGRGRVPAVMPGCNSLVTGWGHGAGGRCRWPAFVGQAGAVGGLAGAGAGRRWAGVRASVAGSHRGVGVAAVWVSGRVADGCGGVAETRIAGGH